MHSKFAPKQAFIKTGSTHSYPKRIASLAPGADTYSDIDEVEDGASPYLKNARSTQKGKLSTRKGPTFYSVPIGETIDTSQIGVTGAADQPIGLITWQAAKLIPATSGRLTKIELNLKAPVSPAPSGPVIVEIRSDLAGSPSTVILATSSVSSISTTYSYLPARFIEAPLLASGTTYWVVVYLQDNGTNYYNWSSTSSATTSKTSLSAGGSWSTTSYGLNFKSYISTASPVLGQDRLNLSNGTNKTVFFHGTNAYTVNDLTGATTQIDSGLSSSATSYSIEQAQDLMFYCNGYDTPRKYDGTTVTSMSGTPISTMVKQHKNRLFFVSASDPSRVIYSEAGDFTSYLSTSFFYVPTSKNPDPVTYLEVLQDNLYIFTKHTKYVLQGSDPSSFVLRRSTGLKGTQSPLTVRTDGFYIFFLSDDNVYRFNGANDEPIGTNILPDIKTIAQPTKATAEFWDQKYYLFTAVAGSGVNNQCFVFDNILMGWFPDTNLYIGRCAVWRNESNQFMQGSSVVGAIYNAERDDSDLGRPIEFIMDTKDDSFGSPSHLKQVRKFFPAILPVTGNYTINIAYSVDNRNTFQGRDYSLNTGSSTFGTFIIGTSSLGFSGLPNIKIVVPGFVHRVRFRFKRTGVGTPVDILGYEYEYLTKRSR